MTALLLAFPLLSACSDYDLRAKDTDSLRDGEDTSGDDADTDGDDASACDPFDFPADDCAASDACDYEVGGFEPIVEWDVPGENMTSLPAVGDLDGDGIPEIVANFAFLSAGKLAAYHGDGSGKLWEVAASRAKTGFGAHPAIADLDDDGLPEVLIVREYKSEVFTFGGGEYSVVAYSWDGRELAESEVFTDDEMDHATAVAVSDMDHDGSPEVVAGRIILNADLTTRGEGRYARGANMYAGIGIYGEGGHPAIADLDLDGEEEVIVGNAAYTPDGAPKWRNRDVSEGAVAVGNLDDDPEGEFVRVLGNEISAHDTDGTFLWGPLQNGSANIFPVPAIGDVDNDGYPEIVVAGGNVLWVLNHDGSLLWDAGVTDMSGATGASMFDFDADGVLEVVYVDEVQIVAYNGVDGVVKFRSNEHASATMYDYPVVADVDADGHAEIVVAHDAYGVGFSVYGDATDSWAPARKLWNQHAYTITNINDDLSVPVTATPNFTVYNSYHSGLAGPPGASLADDLGVEVLDTCADDCGRGVFRVAARAWNMGNADIDAGLSFALYAVGDSGSTLVGVAVTTSVVPALRTTDMVEFEVDADDLVGAEHLLLRVDDDGTGTGAIAECLETNNEARVDGPFCR